MTLLIGLMALASAQGDETPLIPAFFTGERLLEICTRQNVGLCSMYVAGVTDGIFHAETGKDRTLCSGDLTNREARRIVTSYLSDNPEVRKYAAAVAVELALKPWIGCDSQADREARGTADQNGK